MDKNDEIPYLEELRDWRFEAPTREVVLERRVKELEQAISRLERELRTDKIEKGLHDIPPFTAGTIGAIAGTIRSQQDVENNRFLIWQG